MKPNIVGFIFARGGSKSVPRKNIRPLGGKPLIAYAVESALQSKLINRVVVSTDDLEIAEVAKRYGAEVPFMRPLHLATDEASEWLAWQHAIATMQSLENNFTIDLFVSVPPTSPLRTAEDLDHCIKTALNNEVDLVITVKAAKRNPSFNMVRLDENNNAYLVTPPLQKIYRRQNAPPVFNMATVAYVARPSFIMSAESMFDGNVKAVIMPEERAVDIDTELDFEFAEFLLRRSKQKQKVSFIHQ